MTDEIKIEQKVGAILPAQGWVELHGCFTRDELAKIIIQINMHYKGPEKGNKE
jgi:hypothetical protein